MPRSTFSKLAQIFLFIKSLKIAMPKMAPRGDKGWITSLSASAMIAVRKSDNLTFTSRRNFTVRRSELQSHDLRRIAIKPSRRQTAKQLDIGCRDRELGR